MRPAPSGAPPRLISAARSTPTNRGNRIVPPYPGMLPRFRLMAPVWPEVPRSTIRLSSAVEDSPKKMGLEFWESMPPLARMLLGKKSPVG